MKHFTQFLKEASADEIYQYYQKVPKDIYLQILKADPTHQEDNQGNVRMVGKYSKWMLTRYQQKQLKIEDLYKATEYLDLFNRHKEKVEKKDINQYKSLSDLFTTIEQYKEKMHSRVDDRKDANIIYEDDKFLLLTPKTHKSACAWGSGTEWCTAHSESEMFDEYTKNGPLKILIKKPDEKYQFHWQSGQMMDAHDKPVNIMTLWNMLPSGLKSIVKDDFAKISLIHSSSAFSTANQFLNMLNEKETDDALIDLFDFMSDTSREGFEYAPFQFDFSYFFNKQIPLKVLDSIEEMLEGGIEQWNNGYSYEHSMEYVLLKYHEKHFGTAYGDRVEEVLFEMMEWNIEVGDEQQNVHIARNMIIHSARNEKKLIELIKKLYELFSEELGFINSIQDAFDLIHHDFKNPILQKIYQLVQNGGSQDEELELAVKLAKGKK